MSAAGLVVATRLDPASAPADAAGAPPVERRWTGPESCRAEAFDRALRHNLSDVSDAARDATTADVHVQRHHDELQLRLELRHRDTSVVRTFRAPRCEVVSDAAAFAVAMAVDPEVVDRWSIAPATATAPTTAEAPEGRGSLPPPDPSAAPPATASPAGAPAPAPARRWWGSVRGGVGIGGLALPGVGALAGGAAGLAGPWVRVDAYGRFRGMSEARVPHSPGVSAALRQWSLGGRACVVPRAARWTFPVCGGFEGGRVVGRGQGFEGARRASLPWLAAVPGAGLAFFLGWRVGLFAHAELPVVLRRQRFSIDEVGVVHQLGRVAARGLAGIEVRL